MAVTAAREAELQKTADALLTARRTALPLEALPHDLQPATEEEAFAVQDLMAVVYGAVGGWKIGSRGPEGVPFFAPMPSAWMGPDGSVFDGNRRLRGVEAEIAFHMGSDLPPRSTPYTREEVVAAVESCHPAIELLESAYVDPTAVSRESMLADLQMHGGFVAGPAFAGWKTADWMAEHVVLTVDGVVRVENTGSNPGGGDLLRLLVFLANEGAARTGGLKRGDWVTTGSWTGATWCAAGSEVAASFSTAGSVGVAFAAEARP